MRVASLARQIAAHARPMPGVQPVVFFIATARLGGLSQNAAFSWLTSLGLRLAGVPIHYFVCDAGMKPCVLGTNRQDFRTPPPCRSCIRQSRLMFGGKEHRGGKGGPSGVFYRRPPVHRLANVHWFTYQEDADLAATIRELSVEELCQVEYPLPAKTSQVLKTADKEHPCEVSEVSMPLGKLVLPAIRWALRRHTLLNDEDTRYLLREYILSAYNIAIEFTGLLEDLKPSAAVIFNGIMYPEAAARWVSQQLGVRVITHEVGFQRFSAFFTDGDATAYPIHIPDDFELSPEQNARLDEYLENRFQGKFSMAGIRFWPEMRGLDDAFLQKASLYRQIVPVFTNVVYDTSQVHANRVFAHMFAWLDLVVEIAQAHTNTLFVIRAHPDEMRPGTAKQSRESVRDWVAHNGVDSMPNVIFIDSQEYLSSYELIQRAKFVIVYNSSIGMEAALMGAPVLCGGKARYTQYPMVFFPLTPQAYREMAEAFLSAESIEVPDDFRRNARRFLYYQLFRTALSFEDYLEEGRRKGYVKLRAFPWQALLPENSAAIRVILDGLNEKDNGRWMTDE